VCIQKSKHAVVFGILAHDVPDTRSHSTCIIVNNSLGSPTYRTYSYNTLIKAVERLRLNVYSLQFPKADLEGKLASANQDPSAIAMKIVKAVHTFTEVSGIREDRKKCRGGSRY
jgi:hypothetical protein